MRVAAVALGFILLGCGTQREEAITVDTTVPVETTVEPTTTTTVVTTTTTAPPTTTTTVYVEPEPVYIEPEPVYTEPIAPTGSCVIPEHICQRESGGDPMAVNPTGCGGEGCYGKYQFAASTWDSLVVEMGMPHLVGVYLPDEATQDTVASYLWAGGAGCSAWNAC